MYKIQFLNKISAIGLNELPHGDYETQADIAMPDAILVRSHNMYDMQIPGSVLAIGRAGVGVNNIPVQLLSKRGIPVFNTPGANANAVCELVIAGMLLASRNICQAWSYVSSLNSSENLDQEIEQHKKQFAGYELRGKTLGVIGLGSIGVKVANAAMNLGMRVIGYDPAITIRNAWELSSNVKQASGLDELLIHADFISIHVPLTGSTANLLNGSKLQLLKRAAVLLNFARDGLIDLDALMHQLNTNQHLTYVTDFPSSQIQSHPRVIALPHLGASTREAEENCAVMVVKQIRQFLENGTITNSVNFPALDVPPLNAGTRIAIVNDNVPNMVAQISSQLAAADLNILSLFNKSRDDIAYTVIDVNNAMTEATLHQLQLIPGVVKARCLSRQSG